MQFDAELLLLAMPPVFLACLGWEAWYWRHRAAGVYSWPDTRLGWLETGFNTPSIHRAHHARNPRRLDHNYAGAPVIWDCLFGSYIDEHPAEPARYGIVEPLHTYNPLVATFHEWASMITDARRSRDWRNRFKALFGPPEWAAMLHAGRLPEDSAAGAVPPNSRDPSTDAEMPQSGALGMLTVTPRIPPPQP